MKKYRLIKKFPFEGSPEIGYISNPTPPREPLHYWHHHWFNPAEYPEYWIEVVSEPLFKTDDGIDIYEGDTVFGIYKNTGKIFHEVANHSNPVIFSEWSLGKFSTRQAAEDSIIMNKHCLSIKEIAPIIGMANEATYIDLDYLTRNLKELVKSKL